MFGHEQPDQRGDGNRFGAEVVTHGRAGRGYARQDRQRTFRGVDMADKTILKLGELKPAAGSRPKRQRIGRGHGSGMVKTGGEGGKGQTVRSGGGKGPAFEGGQTPWARRLPHKRGYSQKGRDTGHFGSTYSVVNLASLWSWDASVEVTPLTLKAAGLITKELD